MNRRDFLKAGVAGAALAAMPRLSHSAPATSSTRPPNVVLMIGDDWGWTDYSFMGHKAIETPRLDRLARESALFRRGYVAAPLCCPSLASMITGLTPAQHKILGNEPPPDGKDRDRFYKLITKVPTLPRMLGEKGCVSFQTGKWWHGHFTNGGFTDGMTTKGRHGDDGLAIGRKTMQPMLDFIDGAKKQDKPFFLWYAPMLPHTPHTPPADLLEKYKAKAQDAKVAAYWAMCEWTDRTAGELLDHLDKQSLADNTLVIFLADNGWQQGAGPMRGHKRKPYEGGIRTPITIRWPGRIKPEDSDIPVLSTDLAPTILAAWGIKPTTRMQGLNLAELLDGKIKRDFVCGASYEHNMADWDDPAKSLEARWIIEKGRYKLVETVARGGTAGKELFDLQADPHEARDLAADNPAIVTRLSEQLQNWWKQQC